MSFGTFESFGSFVSFIVHSNVRTTGAPERIERIERPNESNESNDPNVSNVPNDSVTAKRWLAVAGFVGFAIVATANGAGYRYGASDQAFYIPVVLHAADPGAFPRDRGLLDAQGRYMVVDEVLAAVLRTTGVSTEVLFLAGYLLSLALIWAGLMFIGTRVYTSRWTVAALAAAFAMRHSIPRTSANSFEPYFHPRMLAFGIGLLAVAAVLRRQSWLAIGLVAVAALVHVTTGMWFAVMLGVALAILDSRLRTGAIIAGAGAAAAGLWALVTGRLGSSLAPMDDVWLRAVASKDSLFATQWPAWAWAANLGFLALLWWAHRRRVRDGVASAEDRALVWGATALVALFLLTLPLVAAGMALPVQLQISRVFWLVDFVALVYVLAVACGDKSVDVASGNTSTAVASGFRLRARREASALRRTAVALAEAVSRKKKRAQIVAGILIAFAASRGAYIMLVERPERALFAVHTAESPWEDAMRWVARQPAQIHVLADPGHAWKHGTSVRASGVHDVFLEEVKDSALAIYSREVASRVVERIGAVGDFGTLTADRAHDLARRYDLDYLVSEADLPLPVVYRNAQFRIYEIR
jgi:hypothetical protein